jgi:hypothetical protein
MMAATPPRRPVESLPALWREWARVVARVAGRHRASAPVTPGGYEAVYRRVLAACDELAAGPDGEHYRHLAETVRPWVTLRALQQADSELLTELHTRSVRITRELHGGREPLGEVIGRVLRPGLVISAVIGVVWAGWLTGLFAWAGGVASHWARMFRLWAAQRSTAELLLLVALVVVAVGWGLVSRVRRS